MFFSERNAKLWLKICRVWSFLLYSTTKLTKLGNYINNFYAKLLFMQCFNAKSLGSLYTLAFKYLYTILLCITTTGLLLIPVGTVKRSQTEAILLFSACYVYTCRCTEKYRYIVLATSCQPNMFTLDRDLQKPSIVNLSHYQRTFYCLGLPSNSQVSE